MGGEWVDGGGSAKAGGGSRGGVDGGASGDQDTKPTQGKPRYYAPSKRLVHNDDGFNALSRIASRSASAIGASRGSYSRGSAPKHASGEMQQPAAMPTPSWNEQRAAFGQLPAPMALHPSLQQQLDSNSMAEPRVAPRPTARHGTRKNAADSFTRLEPLVWLG